MASEKMEELRKVARAYFDGQNEDDRMLAVRFFRSLDENGDGKVSLEEYRRHVDSRSSSDHLFELLDANGDGTLELEEILTLYYMENVLIPRCGACNAMLLSSLYFSCLPCLGKTSYHLCCNCYGGRSFDHRHSSTNFLDTRALLKLMDLLMREAVVAHPNLTTEEVQKRASCSTAKPTQPSPSASEVQKRASCSTAKPTQPSPSASEMQNRASSSPTPTSTVTLTPTKSITGTVVKKLAVCATKAIIIKGTATVAVAAVGCCIM